jgi:hypothetical protein
MLAANGPQWFDRRRPENSWPSLVVSVGITAGLFVSAFLAMQTVGRWSTRVSEPPEPPVVVRLTPPAPPIERPRTTPPPAVRQQPIAPATTSPVQPTTLAPTTGVAPPLAPTTTAPPALSPARDTASGAPIGAAVIPLGPLPLNRSDTALGPPASAAAREAGVTIGSRVPNTAAYRDSMLKAKLQVPFLGAQYAPKGEILAALRQSQATALRTYQRSTTAGSREVHVAQGEGMNGEGAVGGGGVQGGGMHAGSSIGLPLFSSGPSAAQRKKNEAIEADYRDRLHRLENRMLLKRDSIRLDSLRRDSLARRRP